MLTSSLPDTHCRDEPPQRQIQFLVEIDKLNQMLCRTWPVNQSRRENDAEHSWHIVVSAMLFLVYPADLNNLA